MLPGLAIGRIVHYVLAEHDLPASHKHCAGQVIPGIVVNTWPSLGKEDGYANLMCFPDGSNQGFGHTVWITSRTYDEGGKPGTWHWPPRV